MTRATARKTLAAAFGALDDEALGNLVWHVEQGTEVFCGNRATAWFTDEGG